MKILVIDGPNINMLGIREPQIYGVKTYCDLVEFVKNVCAQSGIECECFQSNHEGAIVDKIQDALGHFDAIAINPAAYTHTSVAILDALKAVALPAVEVHLTNVNERDEFRKISYARLACERTFCGMGFDSYKMAVEYLADRLQGKKRD